MDNALQNNDRHAISTSHSSDDLFRNRWQGMRGSPGSSLFRLRGGSKPIRDMDRSDMEKLELDLPKPKAVALSPKSSVPPHLLMTALLEQLCHMHVPNDKKLANEVFMLLCENLSQLNVISSLSHLDEMRLLRKQHGITFKRLLGAALQSIKQTKMPRALTGLDVPLNPIPSKGERILRQEELMDEFLSRYEEEFEELHHLGSGGFGSVYKVLHKLDKRCYAIKKIRFKQKDHELLPKLLREVRVLAQLQHTNIVGYNSTWIESHNPFSSSKGTSTENTTSQGISQTDSPRDRKANNDSQSVEFLSESDRDQESISPRISLQQGSRFFSQVKTSVQIKNLSTTPTTTSTTNRHAASTAFERFNLFDFNQCHITEITELSSSQYSSSSFASSIEENSQDFENDYVDKVLAQTSHFEVKKSSLEVTKLVSNHGDSDTSDAGIGKQAVKRGHPSSEIHYTPSHNQNVINSNSHSYGNDDDDLESHVSSTGFSVSDSRQMSLTSDVSSDIPSASSNLLPTTGSDMEDYLPLYFNENPSGTLSQQTSIPQLPDVSSLQQADRMDSQQASNGDCNQDTHAQYAQGKSQIAFPTTGCVVQNQNVAQRCTDRASSSDANTNHRLCTSSQQQVSSQSCLPLVPVRWGVQRCGSYGGVESKKHSVDDDLDVISWRTGVKDDGKAFFLQPPRFGRSISNVEGGKYRGTGESIDHSYDFQNSIVLFIQMELCSQTLCEWLVKRNDNIDLSTAYQDSMCHSNMIIFKQLLEGVDFIHSQGLIHRDLKPRNIFLSEKDLHVKIGDFGLAKEEMMGDATESPILFSDSVLKFNLNQRHTTGVGTTGYAAPEQIQGSIYDAKSDMYSLGVVLFELFNVFTTDMERMENIKNPGQSQCLADVRTRWPKQSCAICRLTDANPAERPLASELLKGELFVSPEKQIVTLKQTIVEKDSLIESLKREIKILKAEKEELMGEKISF